MQVTQNGTTGWLIALGAGVVLIGSTALRIRTVAREAREAAAAATADTVLLPSVLTSAPPADVPPAESVEAQDGLRPARGPTRWPGPGRRTESMADTTTQSGREPVEEPMPDAPGEPAPSTGSRSHRGGLGARPAAEDAAGPAQDRVTGRGCRPPGPGPSARLISASAVMAGGTALSRVMGFFRLMLLAFLFGNATRQADMFTIANTVPNSMYILLAGGVLNTVLVPQIVRAIKSDPDGGEAFTNRIMTAGLLVLATIATLLTALVPVIIWLYSAEGWKAPELSAQYSSMVLLAYFTMPRSSSTACTCWPGRC